MDLKSFEGEKVRFIDNEDVAYVGYASDYIFAEDNEPRQIEALIFEDLVRLSDKHMYQSLVEFTADEIKSIEILT